MALDAIYKDLTTILQDVFDDDTIVASPNLTANDVDGWDSFAHLRVIAAVEKHFKVSFSASQITSMKNVGEFADIIHAKQVRKQSA